jgi:hypothetical protein
VNGGSRQGCQRFGRHRRRGKKTPTLITRERRKPAGMRYASNADPPKRCSDAVNVRSPSTTMRSLSLRGVSPQRKLRAELGTREVRVHAVRLGGRYRSDASRVFSTGRSQDLLVK